RNFVRFAEPERQDVGIAHARVGDFTDFGRNQRAYGGSSTEVDAGMQRRIVHRMFTRDVIAQPPLYWEVGVRARQKHRDETLRYRQLQYGEERARMARCARQALR